MQIIYKPEAFVSQGIVLGEGLLHLEILSFIPSVFNFGSKYVPHSHAAIATCILVFCAETAICSLPRQTNGLTYPFWTFSTDTVFLVDLLISSSE